MTQRPVVVVSIPSPHELQDCVVLTTIAPLVRTLHTAPELNAVWFQRVNKPDWALRVVVIGEPGWIDRDARPTIDAGLGVTAGAAAFVDEEPIDDKWTGGAHDEALQAFHHHDTWGCIEALEAEAEGRLGSRATFSVLVTERLLDALDVRGPARLAFYRNSFDWAVAAGRWDNEVFEALEQTFLRQRETLVAMLASGEEPDEQGPAGSDAERIARALVNAVRAPLRSAAMDRLELATFAAHAHSNRLGLHASREATLRYLVWRARGGERALTP